MRLKSTSHCKLGLEDVRSHHLPSPNATCQRSYAGRVAFDLTRSFPRTFLGEGNTRRAICQIYFKSAHALRPRLTGWTPGKKRPAHEKKSALPGAFFTGPVNFPIVAGAVKNPVPAIQF